MNKSADTLPSVVSIVNTLTLYIYIYIYLLVFFLILLENTLNCKVDMLSLPPS